MGSIGGQIFAETPAEMAAKKAAKVNFMGSIFAVVISRIDGLEYQSI
jgi:hypothetical protein